MVLPPTLDQRDILDGICNSTRPESHISDTVRTSVQQPRAVFKGRGLRVQTPANYDEKIFLCVLQSVFSTYQFSGCSMYYVNQFMQTSDSQNGCCQVLDFML